MSKLSRRRAPDQPGVASIVEEVPDIFLEAAHGEMVKASVRMFWQRPAASVSRERFKSVLVKVTFPASSLFFTVLA